MLDDPYKGCGANKTDVGIGSATSNTKYNATRCLVSLPPSARVQLQRYVSWMCRTACHLCIHLFIHSIRQYTSTSWQLPNGKRGSGVSGDPQSLQRDNTNFAKQYSNGTTDLWIQTTNRT